MSNSWNELKTKTLFRSPEHSIASDYLMQFEYPWQALSGLSDLIRELGNALPKDEYTQLGESVWVAKSAKIAPTAALDGPCIIIGPEATVRHCALIRENVIIGKGVNVGHCTGIKNSILFDEVQVPHYNYVGDSILGYKSHLGASALTSNLKSDKTNVSILINGEKVDTGRQKVGSMLGDFVEVGAGTILNPGTVIGEYSNVYPLVTVRGYVPPHHIFKSQGNAVKKEPR
ncbi:MAG: UDP-N-acetylglucosamine pyrophosphorylase [Clostridia bacterium]|nr:UDP-N-acetylglucosamine pyrophosphorylase [Clostridia bacterium]